jgi:multiple sugar transport system substrate-binding protein
MTDRQLTRLLGSNVSRRGFLVGGGASALLLAGCGGGQGVGSRPDAGGEFTGKYTGPDVTLKYWNGFTGGDGPTMRAMVDQFNKAHDNITVKNNTVEWLDFYQRLPAAAKAGKGPEVGVMHLDQLATNAVRDVIVPLDDVASQIGLEQSDFTSQVWQPGIYDGSRYGIPLDVHCLAMYWNQDHFDDAGISEPPTDAASLDEACQKLQEAGHRTPFWMPNQWPAHLMFFSLLWQHGGEPYSADGTEATFASDAGVAALSWMVEQVDKGYSPANVDIDAQYLAFKNGDNSITWDGIWQINDLEASGINYGIAPIPTIGDQPAVWANSHHFFLTAQAAENANASNASKLFISELSQQSGQWAEAGMIPARNSAREDASYTESPQSVLDPYLENLHFLPAVPGLGDVTPPTLEVAVNEAVLGKTPPEEALSQQADNATQMMQENLEKFGG